MPAIFWTQNNFGPRAGDFYGNLPNFMFFSRFVQDLFRGEMVGMNSEGIGHGVLFSCSRTFMVHAPTICSTCPNFDQKRDGGGFGVSLKSERDPTAGCPSNGRSSTSNVNQVSDDRLKGLTKFRNGIESNWDPERHF